MGGRLVGGVLALCLLAFGAKADIVSASSRAFSFPAFTGVKQGPPGAHPSGFSVLQNSAGSRVLTFTWSVPAQSQARRGAITIYSLRGRAIRTLPVSSSSGTAAWYAAKDGAAGFYIARLVYGQVRQNIRLMLCR
jgi:hypothetical protein